MKKNVGKTDSYIRYGLAAIFGITAFVLGTASVYFVPLIIVALILVATGALGICGLYKLIGVNTCPLEKR